MHFSLRLDSILKNDRLTSVTRLLGTLVEGPPGTYGLELVTFMYMHVDVGVDVNWLETVDGVLEIICVDVGVIVLVVKEVVVDLHDTGMEYVADSEVGGGVIELNSWNE